MSRETHIAKVEKFCHIDGKTACQDYLNNVFIDYASVESIYRTEEKRLKNYGQCQECGNIRECIEGKYDKWCKTCNAAHFRQLFSTWTSGNEEIDYFIQHAQVYAWDFRLALEWYPWEMFSEIEMIGKDNQTPTHNEDFYYNEYVALKTIGETETEDFLNEKLQRWAYRNPTNTVTLYGFTKNETTGQYFHVMRYFKGDLRNRLQLNEENSWQIKIRIARWIDLNLYEIHKAGLIHSYDYCQIGDLGLTISVSEASSNKNLSGVMPYMAPELLNSRSSYTQAADVYSFEIQDQIDKAEEVYLKNVLIDKEKLTPHPGAIYTSRSMMNITKELATMNFDDFKLPNDFD
ncbi:17029_t:CDS:2 [Dentiscutata heterogama]|uniref:17029_t:CDS:1 n=1 Tax=Dentiscutata heterogama TaxID=1316150 RepID=A0ACA9MRV0_9GLOM|nr:17029_t:CDS:2 [Dentiscutata heterogama]